GFFRALRKPTRRLEYTSCSLVRASVRASLRVGLSTPIVHLCACVLSTRAKPTRRLHSASREHALLARDPTFPVLTMLGHSWDNECPFQPHFAAKSRKAGVFPMTRADSASVPIPPGSPLAIGWRADVAALLIRHGLIEMMDVISAYAELCVRQEPDTALDPL